MLQYSISNEVLVNRVISAKNGRELPNSGTHILIACMPKSGSTFLCTALGHMPGFNNVALTFGFERREQELCILACSLVHEIDYVASHHVRYSSATQKILSSFNIFPVILMRNIFDCVVSLRDHLENEGSEIPIAYLPPHILQLPKEKQYDLIIDLAVPWYANFFACWSEYKGPCLRLFYRDVVRDTPGAIMKILQTVGGETSAAEINAAIEEAKKNDIRFNVGRVGRGLQELTPRQITRIQELFSNYADVGRVDDILLARAS